MGRRRRIDLGATLWAVPRTTTRTGLRVAALLGGLIATACSSGGSTASPSAAASEAGCPIPPPPTSLSDWNPPGCDPRLIPFLVTNNIAKGEARILFLYLDAANAVASAPDRSASVAFYDLDSDPTKAVATAEGTFVWTIQDERGMYVLDVELPEAGTWGAEFTTEAPGSAPETVRLTFDVQESSPTVAVGDVAPASVTPTLADVGGDVSKISTDTEPNPDFYMTSVADALADHEPFILVFATPKFCTSAQCGPTLDHLKTFAAENPDVTFINVEPYQLEVVEGQLQPRLDATGNLQATDVANEWGLLTEPWIFAVDREGVVRGSYELIATDAELDAVLEEISATS
jgi:hypothetical protein